MRSHLLEGRVRHRRLRPFDYQLDHAVSSFGLDLSELDAVDDRLRLISRNRPNVLSFRDADHLPSPSRDLDRDIRDHLRGAGEDPRDWRITLVTNLRVFGYVFNPASFFLCRDGDGELRVVVVEVHNTHGERHLYTLAPESRGGAFAAGMPKDFYVSPFIGMDGRYRVQVRDAADRLAIAITEHDADGILLSTSLVLRRRPMTDRSLLRMLVRHPFMTQRTIGLIHWHALRLWIKGARFHRHGSATREALARRTAGGRPVTGHGAIGR